MCFHVVPETGVDFPDVDLDEHQDRVQRELERSRAGWLSTTKLRGRTYLRAGIMNYMGTDADVDDLLAAVRTCNRAVTSRRR